MFAVREEVEVLKEKIAELMDRINQLEIENSILKANANQETLAQLPLYQQNMPSVASVSNSTRPSSITSNTNTNTSNNIATNNQPP
jgi:regulator of replication initiation timing